MTYKLLTPGPLTTTKTVKEIMLTDHCTWDQDYKTITQWIRRRLLELAEADEKNYTTVLMQGSGSFGVEAVLSSMLAPEDHLLICVNGAYGQRMAEMSRRYGLTVTLYDVPENTIPQAAEITDLLEKHPSISALAMVHSETTSGILNDLKEIAEIAKRKELLFIVDAMSSFGGIPMNIPELGIDFLISSSNKCIQGVPGFSFIIAKTSELNQRKGHSRTLSLDLYDQYEIMERDGKWRFTSPTHTVLAFQQALKELELEGGILQRYQRYLTNNQLVRKNLKALGYEPVLTEHQGPFITSFLYPENQAFDFHSFYQHLKAHGFVIYPGKISSLDCFRIGNIGEIYPEDIQQLTTVIKNYLEVSHDH